MSAALPTQVSLSPREGMYAPSGWLDSSGVSTVLASLIDSRIPSDFVRFSGLRAHHAERLRLLLPPENLKDRQNQAPPLGLLLDALCQHPGLSAGGYMIRAPRWDERVTIDSLSWEDPQATQSLGAPYAHVIGDGTWDRIASTLGISAYRVPDECEAVASLDAHRGAGWWIWWD